LLEQGCPRGLRPAARYEIGETAPGAEYIAPNLTRTPEYG